MATIQFAPRFLKQARSLPEEIKAALKEQIRHLAHDPDDSRLHVKALQGKLFGRFSFRVTRNYRVIFVKHEKELFLLLAVDDRKDIYR